MHSYKQEFRKQQNRMLLIPDKFSLQINMETVILSLIMTIGGGMTGKFGYRGADEAVVQVAIMILVGMYSIYAAKTSEYNSDRKLEQMTQAQEKTEKLLQSVSSMSEQEENSSVLNQITDRVQDLLKVAKQEV